MSRPACGLHPLGRVRRKGYYGKHKEYVRWECVPGNGDRPHYLNRQQAAGGLRPKLVGGPKHGSCDHCERQWQPTDGLPAADRDRYVLRAKAEVLVELAKGRTYNVASQEARRKLYRLRHQTGPRVSRDGRMARDWVPQYTEIIAREFLPASWAKSITVDLFDVNIPAWRADGTPLQHGYRLYSVIAAIGYGEGERRGELWHIGAFPSANQQAFTEFLSQLDGAPEVVVSDGAPAIERAVADCFPEAKRFPCAWHLQNVLHEYMKAAKLHSDRRHIYRAIRPRTEDLFWDREHWEEFQRVALRYLQADVTKADERTIKGLEKIGRWITTNQGKVDWMFDKPHWPLDIKHNEEVLTEIQHHRLGERRRLLRNLPRLNCLLKLMALEIRGEASAAEWARILRDNHLKHHGKPPPRRLVEGQLV